MKHFKELNSTNDKAKEVGGVVVADVQSKGRGRFKKEWSSGLGGAWFSISATLRKGLDIVSAVAVVRSLRKHGVNCNVKWPNDVYVNGKKLAGILTECTGEKCVVGIGINVNNTLPDGLDAVSLKLLGFKVDKDELIKNVVAEFETALKEDFSTIIVEWKAKSIFLNKNVRVKTVKGDVLGRFVDVSEDGCMMLRTDDDEIVKVVEGSVYSI